MRVVGQSPCLKTGHNFTFRQAPKPDRPTTLADSQDASLRRKGQRVDLLTGELDALALFAGRDLPEMDLSASSLRGENMSIRGNGDQRRDVVIDGGRWLVFQRSPTRAGFQVPQLDG